LLYKPKIMEPNHNNVYKFRSLVDREDRERIHGHRGHLVWFTGLSASGKSTIAHQAELMLHEMGCSTYVLDGDNVRHGLCQDLGFSREDRAENLRRIGEMVKLFVDAGIIVLTAFISPYNRDRQAIMDMVGIDNCTLVYVECPVDTCSARDPKGLYKRAMVGELDNFTGVSAPYEPPTSPELVIHSAEVAPRQSALSVIEVLNQCGCFNI
jgi:adenylylsulfate kinase